MPWLWQLVEEGLQLASIDALIGKGRGSEMEKLKIEVQAIMFTDCA